MSLKNGLLIILLSCAALFLTLKNYEVWTHPMESTHENKEAKRPGNKPEPALISEEGNVPSVVNSHLSIAQKNIFSPERKEFSAVPVEQSKPVARPQITLYGVVITPDYQSASVVNPGRPLYKGERETKTVKVGDRVGGYTLAKILPDRITMEAKGDSFDVLLHDPKAPKKRVETMIAEAKTVQPSPVAARAEIQNPGSQEGVAVTKESVQKQLTASPPIRFQGNNLPIQALSRQARSALISQNNASRN
jgi:type II secretory pathway component PulC